MDTFEIIFDGGSLGNPGQGYGSYAMSGPGGYEARSSLEFGDHGDAVTNNQAEYLTLIAALDHLLADLGDAAARATVAVHGDSQLVVHQVTGLWKVRNADLQPLHSAVVERLARFDDASIAWHPRSRSVAILGH